jgi:hypothetical protein
VAGTGAGLLANVLLIPALGQQPAVMTEGGDDDEWRKRLTAKLMQSPSVLLIDNVREPLVSASLAAALTSTIWEDRILGMSTIARLPVRCVWVATANNPVFSDEIYRRTVRIRLDAGTDRPWLRRHFKHELPGWAIDQRADLVWAALTLVRAWIAAGRPLKTRIGTFERWSAVMGGILDVAGVPGFLTNLAQFYEAADTAGNAWRTLIEAWWRKRGSNDVRVSEVWQLAKDAELEGDLGLGSGSEHSQRIAFGLALTRQRDRHYEFKVTGNREPGFVNLQICQVKNDRSHGKVWRLVRLPGQRRLTDGDVGGLGDVSSPGIKLRDSNLNRGEKTSPTSSTSPSDPDEGETPCAA